VINKVRVCNTSTRFIFHFGLNLTQDAQD